jgi:hypothetical protein
MLYYALLSVYKVSLGIRVYSAYYRVFSVYSCLLNIRVVRIRYKLIGVYLDLLLLPKLVLARNAHLGTSLHQLIQLFVQVNGRCA